MSWRCPQENGGQPCWTQTPAASVFPTTASRQQMIKACGLRQTRAVPRFTMTASHMHELLQQWTWCQSSEEAYFPESSPLISCWMKLWLSKFDAIQYCSLQSYLSDSDGLGHTKTSDMRLGHFHIDLLLLSSTC